MNNRTEWLKSLKEGDEVMVVSSQSFHGKSYKILTVKKITPKGRIRLSNDLLLSENGFYRNSDLISSVKIEIMPITEELILKMEAKELKAKLPEFLKVLKDKIDKEEITKEDVDTLKELINKYLS